MYLGFFSGFSISIETFLISHLRNTLLCMAFGTANSAGWRGETAGEEAVRQRQFRREESTLNVRRIHPTSEVHTLMKMTTTRGRKELGREDTSLWGPASTARTRLVAAASAQRDPSNYYFCHLSFIRWPKKDHFLLSIIGATQTYKKLFILSIFIQFYPFFSKYMSFKKHL